MLIMPPLSPLTLKRHTHLLRHIYSSAGKSRSLGSNLNDAPADLAVLFIFAFLFVFSVPILVLLPVGAATGFRRDVRLADVAEHLAAASGVSVLLFLGGVRVRSRIMELGHHELLDAGKADDVTAGFCY